MARGRARIALGDGLAVWLLDAPHGFGDAAFHAHHAVQLTVALTGAVTIEAAGVSVRGEAAAVAADERHRMTGSGLIAMVFVDPEGSTGRGLARSLLATSPLIALDSTAARCAVAALRDQFEHLSGDDLLSAGRKLVAALLPPAPSPQSDARIEKILCHLRKHPGDSLRVAAEAQRVFLSPERLRHLFVEQTGLPHKSYVLWLRMTDALHAYSQGASLTEAAHGAGFADSAHLSRVFRRTFGLPATTMTRV